LPLVIGDFSDRISDGYKHQRVDVTIKEILSSPRPQNSALGSKLETRSPIQSWLFNGVIEKAERNPNGRSNIIELSIVDSRIFLSNYRLGKQSNTQCQNEFLGNGCYIDPDDSSTVDWPYIGFATITSIVGNLISFQEPTAGTGPPAITTPQFFSTHWWIDGFVEIDGLRIKISDMPLDQNGFALQQFLLREPPPPSWNGRQFKAYKGCGKTRSECQLWTGMENQNGNEINFDGYGWPMKDYNPLFESSTNP